MRALVAPHIEGVLVYYDRPDFLICRDNKLVGGLEVTSAVSFDLARLAGQMDRLSPGIETDLLEHTWIASVSWTDTDLTKWDRDRVSMLVRHVEQTGAIDERSLGRDDPVRRELRRLGIVHLFRSNRRDGKQRIYINPETRGRFVDVGDLRAAIAAACERKRSLFEEDMTGRRHLFLWVHPSDYGIHALFEDPPPGPVTLPAWVDEIWVTKVWDRDPDVWHAPSGQPWEVLQTTA